MKLKTFLSGMVLTVFMFTATAQAMDALPLSYSCNCATPEDKAHEGGTLEQVLGNLCDNGCCILAMLTCGIPCGIAKLCEVCSQQCHTDDEEDENDGNKKSN